MTRCALLLLVGITFASTGCTPTASKTSAHNTIAVALVDPVESKAASLRAFNWNGDTYEIGASQYYRVLASQLRFDDWRQREMLITLHPEDAVRFSEWTAMNQGRSIGISIDGRVRAVRWLAGRLYDTLTLFDFELVPDDGKPDWTLSFPSANNIDFVDGYATEFNGDSWIELERTSCAERCPAYSVRVRGDGTVTFKGVSGVAQVGERQGILSLDATRRLFLRCGAADFFAQPPAEMEESTDLASTRVTLLISSNAKRLEHRALMPGSTVSSSETDKLVDVLAWAIDYETRSTRWTGRFDAQPRPRATRDREYADDEARPLEIRLRRNGCYGECPIYEIVIRGDGAVAYKGYEHVGVLAADSSVSRDIVDELVDRFQELGFWEMRDVYDMSTVTDIASASLRLRIGDRTKTVVNRWIDDEEIAKSVGADLAIHRTIERVASAIDTAVDAGSWIHPRQD